MEHIDPSLSYPHIVLGGSERYIAIVDLEDQFWLASIAIFHPRKRPRDLVYAATTWIRGRSKGGNVFMHRLIWEKHNGPVPKGCQIDHKNLNGLDNRKENLRLTDARGNAANRRVNINKTSSRYKGVSRNNTKRIRYRADVISNGVRHCLGTFSNERDAAIAYNLKAKELFGEFALLNDVNMTIEDEVRVRSLILNPKWAENTMSRYVGVRRYYRDNSRWTATICVNRRRIYLGIHNTEEGAAQAYNEAAIRHYGLKAKLNKITDEFS